MVKCLYFNNRGYSQDGNQVLTRKYIMSNQTNRKTAMAYFVGAEVGGVRGPATLVVRPSRLTLYVALERYTLSPDQVLGFREISNQIQVDHISPYCSSKLLFSPVNSAAEILADIDSIGFQPSANPQNTVNRAGGALRWQVCAFGILLWNLLFIAPYLFKHFGWSEPHEIANRTTLGLGPLVAILMAFTISVGARYSSIVQKIILKQGRHFGEVAAGFGLMTAIMGMFLLDSAANMMLGQSMRGIILIAVPAILFGHRLRAFLVEHV
jgi:hypothetical protein